MVCGKSNRNISFNQFYIFGYFQLFTTMFNLLVILFINYDYAFVLHIQWMLLIKQSVIKQINHFP